MSTKNLTRLPLAEALTQQQKADARQKLMDKEVKAIEREIANTNSMDEPEKLESLHRKLSILNRKRLPINRQTVTN